MRDRELVDRFLEGDADAVETVTDWVRASARPFRRRLGSEWDDAVQEALVHVVERLGSGSFEGRSSLKTWVWRLTGYRLVDRFRRLRVRPSEPLDLEKGEPPARGIGPERHAVVRDRWRRALRVLARTSEACRQLWEMLLEGRSRQEMAAELGVRDGTLRVRLHRCRQQADELRREAGEGADDDRGDDDRG